MRHEIGDRHVAGENEGDGARQKADRKQNAADHFDDALKPDQRAHGRLHRSVRKVEQLRDAVLQEQQPDQQADDAEQLGHILADAIHRSNSPWEIGCLYITGYHALCSQPWRAAACKHSAADKRLISNVLMSMSRRCDGNVLVTPL
jgi:hypothetical protein